MQTETGRPAQESAWPPGDLNQVRANVGAARRAAFRSVALLKRQANRPIPRVSGAPGWHWWRLRERDHHQLEILRAKFCSHMRERATAVSDIDGALLMFGELVGNAVEHVGGTILVGLLWQRCVTTIYVHDQGELFEPHPVLPDEDLERGRGLFLVNAFAGNLRIVPSAGRGKCVVATLPVWQN